MRYKIRILNYMVTSNHVHLLVLDSGGRDVIPRSIQLIAGRTGQEYNQRKNRKGAFWEDRYHATAIESDHHLIQCLVYIDMNMVRAGVVSHPDKWAFCGYNEIQMPRQRYTLIDFNGLMGLLGIGSMDDLKKTHRNWVEESLQSRNQVREGKWTESIAVGSKKFAEETRENLGIRAAGRSVKGSNGAYELRELRPPYNVDFTPENDVLRAENTYYWNVYR